MARPNAFSYCAVIRIERKLAVTVIALGACCVIVVAVVVLATQRLSANLDELVHVASVQADLRAFDDALDHARSEADGFLLTRDKTYLNRSGAHLVNAEHRFDRLVSPGEVDPEELRTLATLRMQLTGLEYGLERQVKGAGGLSPADARALRDERDGITSLTRGAIDSLVTAQDQKLVAIAAMQRTADRALWLSVLAFGVIGGVVSLLSYRSMRRDLSRRTRSERALRESEQKFASMLALAADAIVTADEQGRIVNFNQRAEAIFGYRAAEVIGQPLHLVLPEHFRDVRSALPASLDDSLPSAELGGTRLELVARRQTGETFTVEAAVSRLQTSDGFLSTAVLRDITEHRRVERREHLLAEAATRLSPRLPYDEQLTALAQLALPALGDWCSLDVVEEGDDGRRRLHRVTSMPADPWLEGPLWELEAHAPEWAFTDPVTDCVLTGKPLFVSGVTDEWLDAHYSDEQTRAIMRQLRVDSLLVVPLLADAGVIGVLTVGTSSPRRVTTDEFELAQVLAERGAPAIEAARLYRKSQRATAARDALLGIVSHDLTGTLGTISMHARKLLTRTCDETQREKLCNNILEGTTIMRRLMLDLVDISAIEAHRLSVTPAPQSLAPIMELLHEMFAPRAADRGIALHMDTAVDLPDARADATRVVQVLSNLLDNAIKFTAAGGSVDVHAEADGKEILVSVRDTGAGVGPDELPHIFERFWRARSSRGTRGIGLGLAIVNGIVTAHGGRIWMESAIGRGSTVHFTLPRATVTPGYLPTADLEATVVG